MTSDVERWVKDADDDGLREFIKQAEAELKTRDAKRKEQAREAAQAILARAAEEARSVLERVGLPFAPGTKRVRRVKPVYRSGQLYSHPDNATLRWNGKGVRPRWVRELEAAGRRAVEATV